MSNLVIGESLATQLQQLNTNVVHIFVKDDKYFLVTEDNLEELTTNFDISDWLIGKMSVKAMNQAHCGPAVMTEMLAWSIGRRTDMIRLTDTSTLRQFEPAVVEWFNKYPEDEMFIPGITLFSQIVDKAKDISDSMIYMYTKGDKLFASYHGDIGDVMSETGEYVGTWFPGWERVAVNTADSEFITTFRRFQTNKKMLGSLKDIKNHASDTFSPASADITNLCFAFMESSIKEMFEHHIHSLDVRGVVGAALAVAPAEAQSKTAVFVTENGVKFFITVVNKDCVHYRISDATNKPLSMHSHGTNLSAIFDYITKRGLAIAFGTKSEKYYVTGGTFDEVVEALNKPMNAVPKEEIMTDDRSMAFPSFIWGMDNHIRYPKESTVDSTPVETPVVAAYRKQVEAACFKTFSGNRNPDVSNLTKAFIESMVTRFKETHAVAQETAPVETPKLEVSLQEIVVTTTPDNTRFAIGRDKDDSIIVLHYDGVTLVPTTPVQWGMGAPTNLGIRDIRNFLKAIGINTVNIGHLHHRVCLDSTIEAIATAICNWEKDKNKPLPVSKNRMALFGNLPTRLNAYGDAKSYRLFPGGIGIVDSDTTKKSPSDLYKGVSDDLKDVTKEAKKVLANCDLSDLPKAAQKKIAEMVKEEPKPNKASFSAFKDLLDPHGDNAGIISRDEFIAKWNNCEIKPDTTYYLYKVMDCDFISDRCNVGNIYNDSGSAIGNIYGSNLSIRMSARDVARQISAGYTTDINSASDLVECSIA